VNNKYVIEQPTRVYLSALTIVLSVVVLLPAQGWPQESTATDKPEIDTEAAKRQLEDAKAKVKASADEPIRLESTFIGDKEQPSVSYFIPWKGTESPDKLRWKIERKNDDTLNVVDRDIMLRSMTIYNEMQLEKID